MIPNSASFSLKVVGHRDAVEDRIDGHACQHLLLRQRDTELLVGAEQLGVDLVQALGTVLVRLRRRVVNDALVVDLRIVDHRPPRARPS